MKLEKARIEFSKLQKKLSAFHHATALIYYDGETSAPVDTLNNRTMALTVLNEEIVRLSFGPETMELLFFLDENKFELTVNERRAVEFMLRDYNRRKNIPVDEYVRYENLLAEAEDAWHRAREANDFRQLSMYLGEVFNTSRHFALLDDPDGDPYQYWLSRNDDGLEVSTCDAIFGAIKEQIPPLVKEISESKVHIERIDGDFPPAEQETLALHIMELLGVNLERVGFATGEHPFTTMLGSHYDERIVTKYLRKDFSSSMYSVIYGVGRVLCDMGQADNLAYTVLDGIVSMVILQSQAYIYEHAIGRSREFIESIYPELAHLFPEYTKNHTAEDIYKSVNKVEPGLIRLDADELTYMLHTMIRYELEKAIIRRELDIKDLPDAWNEMYKKHLGVDVPDDLNGVLQDVHWPFGAIGNFPTYVVGNVYGYCMTEKMQETIDMKDCISKGDYTEINKWAHERIWKHGGIYKSDELMQKFVKAPVDADAYIKYIKNKYKEIYKL